MSTQKPVTETANDLSLRTDKQMAKVLCKAHLITRGKMQRENCWKSYENNAFIDTMVRGWACTPIYIIRKIDKENEDNELNDSDDEHQSDNDSEENVKEFFRDEVFDGAHKLEAAINFIKNKFPLEPNDKHILNKYAGKTFEKLPLKIQEKILNYNFTINYIDEDTANDRDNLKLLWARLNKEGQKLNDFELALPTIHELVHQVLRPSFPHFLNNEIVFPKSVSKRGALEDILQIILATSETDIGSNHLKNFSSKKGLIKIWQHEFLGDKITKINENIEQNKEKWLSNLSLAKQYLQYLSENNCFVSETGENILDSAHRGTEIIFLLGRAVYHFPKAELFRRICPALSNYIREKYFTEKKDGKWVTKVIRNEAGRNGLLQRKLLYDIDTDVQNFIDDTRRKFSSEMIEQRLKEQNGMCNYCKKSILRNQPYEGDHIVPWSQGGKTEYENLQILHRRCNKEKGASNSSPINNS